MKSIILSIVACALLISFLWYSGNSHTIAATPTVFRLPTNTFSVTLTPTPNPKLAERARKVVHDLSGTDMHDHDFRTSTGMIEGHAILTIFLSESEKGERETIEQIRRDYPILICDLIEAGFTEYISITGLVKAEKDDDEDTPEEVPLSVIVLESDILAKLNCAEPARIDVFKLPQPATYPDELAIYIPTMTPTPTIPTSTPKPADLAAKVVRDLHDTNINDSDLMASTSSIPGRAVLLIFLSEDAEDAARQAQRDFPILICDLREAGFTNMIAITGSLDDEDRVEGVEISLGEFAIASLDCSDPTSNDVFAIADSVSIHPDLARYFDIEDRAAPVVQTTLTPVNAERYITVQTANMRSCPSTSCDIVGTFSYGEVFYANVMIEGWYRFTYLSGEAWVSADLTSVTAPAAATSAPRPTISFTVAPQPSGASCGGATKCTEMTSCEQAYACLAAGNSRLDADDDGVPCESICPGG